jgi:hypothetical protein
LSTMRAYFAQVEIIAIVAESSLSAFETADCIYVKVQPGGNYPVSTQPAPHARIK